MNSVTELMVIFGFLESDAAIASYNHNGIGNSQVFDIVYKLSEFAVDIAANVEGLVVLGEVVQIHRCKFTSIDQLPSQYPT